MKWAREAGEKGPDGSALKRREDFFTSSLCRVWFKNFITHVLSRVNTLTGVPYKDDPAIFAWQLINGASLLRRRRQRGCVPGRSRAFSWHAHSCVFCASQ